MSGRHQHFHKARDAGLTFRKACAPADDWLASLGWMVSPVDTKAVVDPRLEVAFEIVKRYARSDDELVASLTFEPVVVTVVDEKSVELTAWLVVAKIKTGELRIVSWADVRSDPSEPKAGVVHVDARSWFTAAERAPFTPNR